MLLCGRESNGVPKTHEYGSFIKKDLSSKTALVDIQRQRLKVQAHARCSIGFHQARGIGHGSICDFSGSSVRSRSLSGTRQESGFIQVETPILGRIQACSKTQTITKMIIHQSISVSFQNLNSDQTCNPA